jgi:hypothetical protein
MEGGARFIIRLSDIALLIIALFVVLAFFKGWG